MSNTKVNSAATQQGVIRKNQIAILGVFGPKDKLRALVRLSNGRVEQVKTGDRVASGQIVAIDDKGIMLRQRGQTKRIDIAGS